MYTDIPDNIMCNLCGAMNSKLQNLLRRPRDGLVGCTGKEVPLRHSPWVFWGDTNDPKSYPKCSVFVGLECKKKKKEKEKRKWVSNQSRFFKAVLDLNVFFFKLNVRFLGHTYCSNKWKLWPSWQLSVTLHILRNPFSCIKKVLFFYSEKLRKKCYVDAFAVIYRFSKCDFRSLLVTTVRKADLTSFFCL